MILFCLPQPRKTSLFIFKETLKSSPGNTEGAKAGVRGFGEGVFSAINNAKVGIQSTLDDLAALENLNQEELSPAEEEKMEIEQFALQIEALFDVYRHFENTKNEQVLNYDAFMEDFYSLLTDGLKTGEFAFDQEDNDYTQAFIDFLNTHRTEKAPPIDIGDSKLFAKGAIAWLKGKGLKVPLGDQLSKVHYLAMKNRLEAVRRPDEEESS